VNTRELALGFPGCRNAETPKPIHITPFRGFAYQDFVTGKYKETYPWVSQVPKHQNLFTLNHFGISQLANTRELALGFSGSRNSETPKPIHITPFRGFAYQDFMTGEYKGTCPWVSRVPKRRNTKTYSHYTISGFRISRLHDWRIQGNLPLGFPGAETPKHQNLFMLNHFRVSHIRISRLENTRELALGFPECQNTETPKPEYHSLLYKVSRLRSHDPSAGSWVIIPRLGD
jgi:hypothetical protein